MNPVSTVGLDLAKYIFQLHGADSAGAVVFRQKLRRGQLLAFLATLPINPSNPTLQPTITGAQPATIRSRTAQHSQKAGSWRCPVVLSLCRNRLGRTA